MKNLEIPLKNQKPRSYRFLERLPAILTYGLLATPLILSQISPKVTTYFILGYLLMWIVRALGLNVRVLQGWRNTQRHQKYNWQEMLEDIENRKVSVKNPKWHKENIERLEEYPAKVRPSEVIHVAIVAIYNESKEIIEPTIQSVINSKYDIKNVILIIAYEERGGSQRYPKTL